jgi:hypothetical protein
LPDLLHKLDDQIEGDINDINTGLVKSFAMHNLLLSLSSSLAGILSAIAIHDSYSSILDENRRLNAAIVMIIFQSIFTGFNLFVMMYMWKYNFSDLRITKPFVVIFQVSDLILEIIIISLLGEVKDKYN